MISIIIRAAKNTVSYPAVAIWILIAVGAAVMGPFGTYSGFGWLPRSIYWFAICGSSVFLSQLVRGIVGRYIRDVLSWRFDVIAIAGVTLVLTPFVFKLTQFMVPAAEGTPPALWRIGLFVLLIGILLTAIRRIYRFQQLPETMRDGAGRSGAGGDSAPAGTQGAVQPMEPVADAHDGCRLHQRLPMEMREPILHLSARDHFVDVETVSALYSLRMRFADAVAEMDGVAGHVIHRSHWISADAIRGPKREGGKMFLVLSNGTKVPVSRTYRPRLEAAGIL